VLDAFDEWRRAVGVAATAGDDRDNGSAPSRKPSLAAHLERVIARLAHARGTGAAATELHRHIDEIIRELEGFAAPASRARGEARAHIVSRLAELDVVLLRAATTELAPQQAEVFRHEAAAELAPFGSRMPHDARERAIQAAFHRLVREAAALPILNYE